MEEKNKIIVILGPTSSGKSAIAIKLARKFDGEIISADSRQIYRGMDIGTGKIARDFSGSSSKFKFQSSKLQLKNKNLNIYWSNKIAHYLIDIVEPKGEYNVVNFKRDAQPAIKNILSRGKLPIICGGTGFWIKSIVDNMAFPQVKPDLELRKRLGKETTGKLFQMLAKLDPERANNIDKNNKIRIIRAIEICKTLGKVPKIINYKPRGTNHEFLQIGIEVAREILNEKIKKRLKMRFRAGMIDEVMRLRKKGLGWKKIQSFGLAYFWIPLYLENKISLEELYERVYLAEKDYAKRQMTWLRKDKRILWLKSYKEIEKKVKSFLR
jgi:tRNA dimethylallyltransferase